VPEQSEIARLLMLNFPGWRCWYGSMTEAWWSLPPPGHPHDALIEAPTPHELVLRIRDVQTPSDHDHPPDQAGPSPYPRSRR
jgi:hypothetical protein